MAAAWLLTLLAIVGIAAGVLAGQWRMLSTYFAAAGGGLLFGIALFWLIPDIAETSGWLRACALAIAVATAMLVLDRLLLHRHHLPSQTVLGPLLFAAAVHSFLDGWSVRAFSGQPLAGVAVPLGLAMHKVPEGIALGWATHRVLGSTSKALAASAAVECVTLLGAFVEPRANASGLAQFGAWWPAAVLATIAGSFLFLGLHALWPGLRRPAMVIVFLGTLALIAVIRP